MSIPARIGKYEVLDAIGRGGFATVYRARDPLMRRVVAIKLCAEPDEDLRRRFLREAQIAGSLDHPNIVRGFDCGFDEVGVYLVEEYLDGEDLKNKIQSRLPVPHRFRVAILIEVAQAMGYAHSKGIFHRDLKPGNIRVLESGRVKIMDFGVAKTTSASVPLTKAGTVLGTAGYIAPEQVLGQPFDHRVDIFAFGALAYELLTYTRPFTGQTIQERLRSVLDTEPEPISRLWSECPSSLERTIHRCLEKDPVARYQNFAEVLVELDGAHTDLQKAEEERTATFERDPAATPANDASSGFEKTLIAPVEIPPPPPPPRARPLADPTLVAPNLAPPANAAAPAPVPKEPAAATPQQRPAEKARAAAVTGATGKRIWIVATGVGLAAIAAAVALWVLPGRRGESAVPAASVTAPDAGAPAGPSEPVAAPAGRLVVSAAPWGEVVKVTASDGRAVEVRAGSATPLVLDLPPGDYEVQVARPGADDEPRSCRVAVQASALAQCRVELGGVTGLDYMKASGWWP